jgi:hypothetical protein
MPIGGRLDGLARRGKVSDAAATLRDRRTTIILDIRSVLNPDAGRPMAAKGRKVDTDDGLNPRC